MSRPRQSSADLSAIDRVAEIHASIHDCEGLDGDVPLVERSIQIGQMANAILHNSECDAGIAMIATELHLRVSLPAP